MNSIAKFSEICSQFPQAFFTNFLQSIKYKLAQTNLKKNILLYLKKRYMKIHCLSQKWHHLGNIHSNARKKKERKNRVLVHPCFLQVSRLCSHSRCTQKFPSYLLLDLGVFLIKVQAAAFTKKKPQKTHLQIFNSLSFLLPCIYSSTNIFIPYPSSLTIYSFSADRHVIP